MTELIFIAQTKYKSKCDICKKDIPIGEQALWDKPNKKFFHTSCKPMPKQKDEPQPQKEGFLEKKLGIIPKGQQSEVRIYTSFEQAREEERNEIVRKRLAMAKKGISEELGIPEKEIHQDSPLLVEYMRQLSSEKWILKKE